MNAVAIKPPAAPATVRTPTEKVSPKWHTAAYAGRAAVTKLLTEALGLSKDANEDSSGWAHRLISNAITSNETSGDDTQYEIADTACNVEAALQGVLNLPDDPVVPVVRAKLEHAISILEAIATFNAEEISAAIETAPSAALGTLVSVGPNGRKPNATYVAATGDDWKARLATLQAACTEADEKLEMAYDAAERGEPVDTLLDHINHALLPDAVRPMFLGQPTKADAAATYDALFAPLACLEGALALAAGTVIHGTLKEAFDLLDWAQTECDGAALGKLLPAQAEQDDRQHSERETAPSHSFEANGIEDGAYLIANEAIAIIRARAEEVGSDLVYGAIYVAERAKDILGEGIHARDVQMCEDASAPLAVAIAVLEAGVHAHDDVALHGALRLLELAKTSLDDAIAEVQ
ncbi:hypothetical protein M0765_026680 [Variovorax sp. S2]|uniref:hypothetical protein n=1 Tax=Variovorax sp. S12S4 TaxID=3029170 RepID=UPI00215B9526|nr:hypothetical protein [Variovorax sp. S12S4]MCR8961185.1 hypothetical protein [Variovorax sp. S12S4]